MTKVSNRKLATGASDISALSAIDTRIADATKALVDRGLSVSDSGVVTGGGKTFNTVNDIKLMSDANAKNILNTQADIDAAIAQLPQEVQILKDLIDYGGDVTSLDVDKKEYDKGGTTNTPAYRLKKTFEVSKDFAATDDLAAIMANPTSAAAFTKDYQKYGGGKEQLASDIAVIKKINDKWVQAQNMRKALIQMGYSSRELESVLGPNGLTTPKSVALVNGGMGYSTKLIDKIYSAAHYAMGGLVAKGYADGGPIYGTDTISAMLTPGEFVMKKSAVESIGVDKLSAMNNGTSAGESVYNYSITVNATGNMDANELARKVMEQIKQVDSQRMRSNNY
jgi:hypothetical protein